MTWSRSGNLTSLWEVGEENRPLQKAFCNRLPQVLEGNLPYLTGFCPTDMASRTEIMAAFAAGFRTPKTNFRRLNECSSFPQVVF
jgi:hypothetical protein